MTLMAQKGQGNSVQQDSAQQNSTQADTQLHASATLGRVYSGQGPILKNWKISARDNDGDISDVKEEGTEEDESASAGEGIVIPSLIADRGYAERHIRPPSLSAPFWLQAGQAVAVFLTVAWVTYAGLYFLSLPGSVKSVATSPLALGLVLACVMTPVAMLWLCVSAWQRRSDAHIYAYALKQELRSLLFPTEEQSRLIGEDLQLLMRQASEMSATSRATVKAIQRARSGLRTEIRDFSGVTQKAEFHIDRLADSLSKRAEELLSLTETIEAQTDVISQKSVSGVQKWENVSAEISELGEEIEALFNAGAEKIVKAGELAGEKAAGIEGSMTETVTRFSARIDEVAERIEHTREKVETDTGRLDKTAEAISAGVDRLEGSLKGAERISQAVEGVMDVMSGSLEKVESTSRELFDRTGHIEKTLAERAENLKSSAEQLLSSTGELEKVGDLARHKLGEALSMAVTGADSITAAVRKSKDLMDKAVQESSGQIEQSSRMVVERMDGIRRAAQSDREEMAALIEALDEQNRTLSASGDHLIEQRDLTVEMLSLSVEALDNSAESLSRKVKEPVELISKSIDRLGERTVELDDKLSVRLVELEQGQGKIRSVLGEMNEMMSGNLEETERLTDRLLARSEQMNGQIENHRDGLLGLVDELERRTSDIAGLLNSQSQSLSDTLNISESQIGLLGEALFEKGDRFISRVEDVTRDVMGMEQRITQVLDEIESKTSGAEDAIGGHVGRISAMAEQTMPDCTRMIAAAETLEAKYAALRESYSQSVETASECLNDLGGHMDERLEKLRVGVLESSKTILGMSEDLGNSMTGIRQVAECTQENLSKIGDLQQSMGDYARNVSATVEDTSQRMLQASELFDRSTEDMDSRVEAVTRKILDGARLYMEEGQRMSLLAEQAAHKSSRIVNMVREDAGQMAESVRKSLVDLQKSGETLAVRSKEIETYMQASLANTENYGAGLRQQVAEIAGASMDVVDQISDATTLLTARMREVRQAGNEVTDNMEVSRQKLVDESSRMTAVTRKAIEAADEVVTLFGRNSASLYRTVQDMAEQVGKIRDVQLRSEREAFLSASKFVIESLYSLAVDISRHLEEDIDPRVLRAYQRGDVVAFTRHLVETSHRIPLERAQRKFIEDSEFRTYVLRFIRQFEEVLDQAGESDYDELLVSMFDSSDVGKLYKFLSEIAGRSGNVQ